MNSHTSTLIQCSSAFITHADSLSSCRQTQLLITSQLFRQNADARQITSAPKPFASPGSTFAASPQYTDGGGVDGYGCKLSHHHHPAGTSKARGSRSIGRPGYGRTANPNPADPVPRQRLTSALRHLVCYYNLQTLGAGARSLFSPSFPVAHWATMVRSLQKGLTKTRCPFCSL